MKKVQLTRHEWQEAMKVPLPHRNRKKYFRKEKHKKRGNQFGSLNYCSYIYNEFKNKGYVTLRKRSIIRVFL
jgi:hypothetical protein